MSPTNSNIINVYVKGKLWYGNWEYEVLKQEGFWFRYNNIWKERLEGTKANKKNSSAWI